MPVDASTTLKEFLAATAAKQPTPGGGAVAAVCGALSAAIGEMVLNYSVGRKSNAAGVDERLTALLNELTASRQKMLELMVADQLAYDEFSAAKKLPETDPARLERVGAAIGQCIRTPQSIARTALSILETADRSVDLANRWLISDLAVCVELAMATIRCAVHNVRINLGELPRDRRSPIHSECDEIIRKGVVHTCLVMPKISAAMNHTEPS
jgi:methenyltetrahydrofolate cyclohydrolase